MSEKRYTYLDYSRNGYIGSFFENDKPLTNKEVVDILKEQKKEIQQLKKELKNRKKMNNILEGFLLDKGYDFNDILKFLQDRTETGEGK